jgi:hypothetical protein
VKLVLCLAAIVLAGCSEAPATQRNTATRDTEAALAKTPVPRSYSFEGSELKIIEVPVRVGKRWVDTQRCFVYRDFDLKSASISCEAAPSLDGVDPHADR